MQTFGGDESFLAELVAVGVTEDDTGKRCTATSVVDDLLDDSANVAIALSEIEITQTCGIFVVVGMRFELVGRCIRNSRKIGG